MEREGWLKYLLEFVKDSKKLLSFVAGLIVGASLTVGVEETRYLPMGLALGGICFGFGIVLMEFFALRRQREESHKTFENWVSQFSKLSDDKEQFEESKREFEARKADWEEQFEESKREFEAQKDDWEEKKLLKDLGLPENESDS